MLGPDHVFWEAIKHINVVAVQSNSRVQVLLMGVYCAPSPTGMQAANYVPNTPVRIGDGWSLSYLSLDDVETSELLTCSTQRARGTPAPGSRRLCSLLCDASAAATWDFCVMPSWHLRGNTGVAGPRLLKLQRQRLFDKSW